MSEAEAIQRVFLGTGGPALHAAADWLLDQLAAEAMDLGEAMVVVPGGRAQRRLNELLVERSAGVALIPPRVVTIGRLADALMPSDGLPTAGALASLMAWSSVLREAEPASIQAVTPDPPGRDDWPGWWSLAREVMAAADELGAQRLVIGDVAELSSHPGDAARWSALSGLSRRYEALLAERGLVDRHRARLDAIASKSCDYPGSVVMLATADLQPVQTAMLEQVDGPVYALIAADPSDAAGFDRFGGLIASYWNERMIAIEDDAIAVCDRPSDQAAAVLDAVSRWAEAEPTPADAITVGLGDASLSAPIERMLSAAGLPVRSATGQPIARTRPTKLLHALGEFGSGGRFDQLAALLRHPDAEVAIAERAGDPGRAWLTVLDRYATDHLATRPTSGWLGEQAASMQAVYRAATSLMPESARSLRPLCDWAEPIANTLAEVYGEREFSRFADRDRPIVAALEAIGEVLSQLAALDPSEAPHCTLIQAVTLVTTQLAGQRVPDPGGEPAIELVGYLELLLDDAPKLVVTGLNEHHVPEPPRTSALLPEGVRRSIGLPDDARRLARDGYALSAMLAWRTEAKLVFGKRSQSGDPLMPSRLLLKTDDDTLVRRVLDFVADQGDTTAQAPTLLTPGKHDRFLMPMPVAPPTSIDTLRVTAFRDYLACPYRFYLKHVLRIEALDDHIVELSAGGFGTLAHKALRSLASDMLRGVDDVEAIRADLDAALDRAFAQSYGMDPPVAARVQAEQLRYRLHAFAPRQAAMIRTGWRIEHEEKTESVALSVDGQPFTIRGQIDRIDRHPELGWRLIDYKTSDTDKTPERTHRRSVQGETDWVDLQLPLYLDLSTNLGVSGRVELGYINLPKKRSQTRYVEADWDAQALDSAREKRDWVIRRVREGVFWPPKEPPGFDDGLAGVCGDAVADRMAWLLASEKAGVRV
ncbi:MAG: PD-(D/E)XK nuclease family protein [Phycisphaeraceae bacterium]